jgi:D-3-phosphoglycerate dehydrogenase / 2-oxoglutarate reductase
MTKYTVAIATSSFAQADPAPKKMLEQAGVEIKDNPWGRKMTQKEIIDHLQGVHGLLAGLEPLNREVLSTAKDLKALARIGIGMDNVDQDAARELGIIVSNTPDGPTRAVAELTIACLLSLCRQIPQMNADMHAGIWNKAISLGLKDTPVLFIGYGRIGRAVADLLRPFEPQIMVCDPCIDSDESCPGAERVSLEEGLAKARVISMHAGGNDAILDANAFSRMQEGVILLNSARAGLVDEKSLIQALDSGKISGAWFDVFWKEPYQGELQNRPNVLMTPHVCTYTKQCRRGMETEAVENLLRDLGIKR